MATIEELRALAALAHPGRNPDGTYGHPPEGYFPNPTTGQMTSRDMLRQNAEVGPGRAALAGASQGTSFGLSDELSGGVGYLEGGADMARFRQEQARAALEANQEAHPNYFMGGDIGGAVISSIPLAGLATGKSLTGTIGRGMGIGLAEGAAHGAGRGEGSKDRVKRAIADGLIGLGLGGAAPALISGGKAIWRGLADPVMGAFNAGNSSRANRAIARTLSQSGVDLKDVADDVSRAAREGQPEFRAMDAMGRAGRNRANGLTRSGGDAGEMLSGFLENRQLNQGDRVGRFVDEAFDIRGKTPTEIADALTDARGVTADINYAAARGNGAPVDVRGAVSVIDDRIGPMQGVDIAGDSIDAKLARFRNRLISKSPATDRPGGTGVSAGESDATSVELSDFDRVLGVKQDVQDARLAAERAGSNNLARELKKLERALDGALEESSAAYRTANDTFAADSRMIDAISQGADMKKGKKLAQDVINEFDQLSPELQAQARLGYGGELMTDLENIKAPTANRAKAVHGSSRQKAEAARISENPELYKRRMAREGEMWETMNTAMGGSRTADNQAAQEAAENVAADVGGVLRSAGNFQFGDMVANTARMVAPALTGQNEATRKLIAEALMSSDPMAALSPAVRGQMSEQMRQRIIEALARHGGRTAVNALYQ